jgi:drug/metabolite transporter (DMT)-like permease
MAGDGLTPRALAITTAAMLAFAGNSLLCRLALKDTSIDPASFTAIRLISGAAILLLIVRVKQQSIAPLQNGSVLSAFMLFAYAAAFSYAYVSLGAASGALLLFAAVQGTMLVAALWHGDRASRPEWIGWLLAGAGMLCLLLPGADAPAAGGTALMLAAGIAWGIYSLRGAGSATPLLATAANFLLALPFLLLLLPLALPRTASGQGILLAASSGAVTSGLGYVLWYAALRNLRAMQAALVQLSVPAIAAIGGVTLLSEAVSARLLLAALLILGGIAVALLYKPRTSP